MYLGNIVVLSTTPNEPLHHIEWVLKKTGNLHNFQNQANMNWGLLSSNPKEILLLIDQLSLIYTKLKQLPNRLFQPIRMSCSLSWYFLVAIQVLLRILVIWLYPVM